MSLVTPWPVHISSVLREKMLGKPDSQSGEETLPCCGSDPSILLGSGRFCFETGVTSQPWLAWN